MSNCTCPAQSGIPRLPRNSSTCWHCINVACMIVYSEAPLIIEDFIRASYPTMRGEKTLLTLRTKWKEGTLYRSQFTLNHLISNMSSCFRQKEITDIRENSRGYQFNYKWRESRKVMLYRFQFQSIKSCPLTRSFVLPCRFASLLQHR